jgi:branched-chain amino acid transport system ATP-binding protein
MLKITNLEVAYNRVVALQKVSVEVNQGEIVGIIGPNGAGKSSLLLSVAGVVKPRAGEVVLEGESLLGRQPEDIVGRGLALVPESRRIFGPLTVGENLALGATTRKDPDGVAADMADVFRRFPVLEKYRDTPGGKLSGGEQQQLAIARALLSKPRLLMLDEPTLGLAPRMIDTVFEVIQQLREDGVTILLVEQNARRTVRVADRTYVLHSGAVSYSGDRQSFEDESVLQSIYLGL